MRTAKLMCAEIQIQFHSHLSRLLIGTDVRSLFGRHFVRILVARYRIVTTLPTTWAEHAVSARYYIVTMYGTPLPRPAGRGGQHLICSQGPRPIWARICLVRDSDTAPLCCGVAPVRFPGARESSSGRSRNTTVNGCRQQGSQAVDPHPPVTQDRFIC